MRGFIMKKYAVIVAGGSGKRMGTQEPKQFLLLCGRPVITYTLSVFLRSYSDMQIILVLPEEYIKTGKEILGSIGSGADEKAGLDAGRRIRMVAGGETRFHSVRNGLRCIPAEEVSVVFIHDGVRCLLTEDLVSRCYEEAIRSGSAIPVIDCKDSVRLVTGEGDERKGDAAMGSSQTLERGRVKLVQTPQTFLSTVILPAYEREYQERFTDDATVVEANGGNVQLVQGEDNNFKITMAVDLAVAEGVMRVRADGRAD
jgi:2-C-methyl-D-erythritol 4-phosphate cytidylyltransferase